VRALPIPDGERRREGDLKGLELARAEGKRPNDLAVDEVTLGDDLRPSAARGEATGPQVGQPSVDLRAALLHLAQPR